MGLKKFLLGTCLLFAAAFPVAAQQTVSDFTCDVRTASAQGTGIVVGANDKQLLCVTVAHAFTPEEEKAGTFSIVWQDGSNQSATLLKIDRKNDLAAFTVPSQGNRVPVILGDFDNTASPFRGFGFSNENSENTRPSLRKVEGGFKEEDPTLFAFENTSNLGMSGGAVRDKNSLTVGLLQKRNFTDNQSVAVKASVIRDFISPFVGGVVRVGNLKDNPLNVDTALRRCNTACRNTATNINQPPRFNVPGLGYNVFNNNNHNNNNVNVDLQNQLDVLTLQLQALQNNNNIYNQVGGGYQGGEPVKGEKGDTGEKGEQGEAGPPGPPGPPGTVDVDAVVLAVTKKLQPIKVNFLDGEGKPSSTQSVELGGVLNIPPVKLWWENLTGDILKQAKPLGEPLKAKSVELKKK